MIKRNVNNILFSAIVYIIVLIVCMAMFLPKNVGNVLEIDSPAEATYGISEISKQVGCSVTADGTYTILQPDPQLMFAVDNTAIETIKLTVVSKNEQNVPFEIYTAFADGHFSEERCYRGNILSGRQSAVIDIPKGEYSFLRVDIDQINVSFKCVEVFDEQPVQIPYKPEFSVLRYVITALLPLAIAFVAGMLNNRFKWYERIAAWFSRNRFKIATVTVFAVVAALLAILVELLVSIIAADGAFNICRWLIFVGIAELVVVFVFGYKNLKSKPENLFLPIILILGTVMLFGSPIKHICWDLDSHYPWAVQTSYPGTTYVTSAYNAIDYAASQSLVSPDSDYEQDINYLSEADELFVSETRSEFSIAHLPAGIFMAVARFFGAGFVTKYNLGRLAYLLAYSFVCYFAIKKIKSGKMILTIICLFSTNLFLATNYAYDWCVTAFTLLGTAYFVSELQQPDKPISTKDTIIMGLAFAIGSLPKLVYIILMAMTLFMRKNWASKKEKRKYYLTITLIFAVVFVMFIIRSRSSLSGSGDIRGGDVDPALQVAGILENPLNYAKVLFKFLARYLSIGTMKEYISNFAYLGMGNLWPVVVILLAVTALTDTDGKLSFKIPVYIKILSVLLFVGMAAMIATALYISFTPVGMQTVNGCQPRYIIPLLAPLLLLVTGQRFNLIKNKSIYNGCVLGISSIIVMIETHTHIMI